MKIKYGLLIVLTAALFPSISFAGVDSSFKLSNSYSTGTDSQLEVSMSNYQSTNDLVAVLNFSDANTKYVKSVMFLDKSGWVKLTPYQNGSDVLAKFISDTGFQSGNDRVISFRINFNSPKTYVLGFSLQDSMGKVVSSAAAPVNVIGKVLGESITPSNPAASPSGVFTRTLTYGVSGADVTALQNKLTAEGFYSGPITRFYGRLTQTAVRKYQTAHGITANGVVGPATLAALNQ
jgi:hypothetical protein